MSAGNRVPYAVPFSQVAVAIAFMVERGCLELVRRRLFPASEVTYEDALVEIYALAGARL